MLSRSIITYSAPSAPLAGTSRLHRMAAYTRCPRCAVRPRRPASGSVLSLLVPSRHAVLYDPGELARDLCAHLRHRRHSPSPLQDKLGAPNCSHHPFQVGPSISGLLWFTRSLRPVELLVLCPTNNWTNGSGLSMLGVCPAQWLH